jgi:hypothetical protein
MAGAHTVLTVTEVPDAAINIYRVVCLTATGVAQATSLGQATVHGICQEEVSAADVTAGRYVAVAVEGVSRAIAGAALNRGDPVRTDASGRLVAMATATVNQRQVGIVQETTTAIGDQVDVLLTPGEFRDVP